jgi:hypothetical protein
MKLPGVVVAFTLCAVFAVASPAQARHRADPAIVCLPLGVSGHYVRAVFPLVLVKNWNVATLVSKPADVPWLVQCDDRYYSPFIRENEQPAMIHDAGTYLTVEGDMCAPTPKFIFYDAPDLTQIFGYRDVRGDPMAVRVAAALAIVKARCSTPPREIQIVARKVVPLQQQLIYRARTDRRVKDIPFEHEDFYSAHLSTKEGAVLVSDDAAQEARYWAHEDQRISVQQQQARQREMRQAIGALLGMILLGAAYKDCDPDLTTCP